MAECTSEVFIAFLYTHYGFINGWVYIWSVHCLSIHTLWFYKWLSVHLKCSLTLYTHILVFYMAECTSEVFIDFLYTHYGFINGWVYIWSVHWLYIHTFWFSIWLSVWSVIDFIYKHFGFLYGWVYIWSVHWISIHTFWFSILAAVHLKCSLTSYTHHFGSLYFTSEVFIDFLYSHYGFINGWVYIWSVHWLSIHTLWFYKWLSVHLKCSLTFYTHIMVFYMAECTSEVFIDFLYTHYGFINSWVHIWSVHCLSIHTLWFYKWLSVHLKCSLPFYTHIMVL